MEFDYSTVLIGIIAFLYFIDKVASWVVNIDRAKGVIDKHNPATDIKARLDKHEELLERDRLHLLEHDKDIKKLNSDMSGLIAEVKENNTTMVKLMFMMLDGMTGEASKEDLKEAKAELLEHVSK